MFVKTVAAFFNKFLRNTCLLSFLLLPPQTNYLYRESTKEFSIEGRLFEARFETQVDIGLVLIILQISCQMTHNTYICMRLYISFSVQMFMDRSFAKNMPNRTCLKTYALIILKYDLPFMYRKIVRKTRFTPR